MYINDSYVNLRKSASTSSDIIMVVELNTKLTVIGEDGDWYKVKTSSGNAYVLKTLLSNEKKKQHREVELQDQRQHLNQKQRKQLLRIKAQQQQKNIKYKYYKQ